MGISLNFFSVQLEGNFSSRPQMPYGVGSIPRPRAHLLFWSLTSSSADAEYGAVSGLGLLCGRQNSPPTRRHHPGCWPDLGSGVLAGAGGVHLPAEGSWAWLSAVFAVCQELSWGTYLTLHLVRRGSN